MNVGWTNLGGNFIRLTQKAIRIWRHDGWSTVLKRTVRKLLHMIGIGRGSVNDFPSVSEYRAWIAANEPDADELAHQEKKARELLHQPLVSIVVPVFDSPSELLRDTIESVLRQTYGNWELCLVDGGSSPGELRRILENFARQDSRIRMKFLDKNLGTSDSTNKAMEMATGEFIAFLDPTDLLAPDMLFEVVRRVNDQPRTDIVYFDEDAVSADGKERYNPQFKPQWSPDMLVSTNYLAHAVVRRSLVEQVGGHNAVLEGAQAWDFMFRCTEKAGAIEHVAKVCYHSRTIPGRRAATNSMISLATANQLRAVSDHLGRQGVENVKVHMGAGDMIRAVWPTQGRKVSIIVPTKDKVHLLKKCLSSVLDRTSYKNFEIVLMDTGSREKATHDYYQELRREPRVRIIDDHSPFNYSRINNLGAKNAQGELLLFLNNDTEVLTPDWLDELVRWAERPEVGVVGAMLLYPNNKIQHAGVVIGMGGQAGHVFQAGYQDHHGIFGSVEWYRNYSAVTGACMMISRRVFDQVLGFDENYQLAYSDVVICLQIADLGYRVVCTPHAVLHHYEGATRFDYTPEVDHMLAYRRMKQLVVAGDPYFNPNLSYIRSVPTLKYKNEEGRLARLDRALREIGLTPSQAKAA